MSFTRLTRSKTAREIRNIIDALDLDDVARYFEQDTDEIDPYVTCEEVSVDAFNKYIGDGEKLRIGLRFLQLSDDGRILIVDLSSPVHEVTVRGLDVEFLAASGNGDEVKIGGSTTVKRAGYPKKEADSTFGPLRSTPNRTAPPSLRTIAEWVTLAVEVGRAQTWASLEAAATVVVGLSWDSVYFVNEGECCWYGDFIPPVRCQYTAGPYSTISNGDNSTRRRS
ncbi:unnamed protein product [Phytophthora lilii]|uniref:Unnamed protein product n=1 Tax=Phytophthora lilii TaxID=2077276 RepID=A0A9W6TG93_9STRA|nr:unnamed protein product [Phytophthora lilii]